MNELFFKTVSYSKPSFFLNLFSAFDADIES